MREKLKLQRRICKIQMFETMSIILVIIAATIPSGLLWYLLELHPLVFILLTLLLGSLLFLISYAVCERIKRDVYKRLDEYIFIKLDESIFTKILPDLKKFGVLNITKQNRFLFFKSTIDNFALYYIEGITSEQQLKKTHRDNIGALKKRFPDIKNQYLSENHLRLNVQIFVTNQPQSLIINYISKNINNLYDIGQFRCVVDISTFTAMLPSYLPKGIGIADSVFYLKVVDFLKTLTEQQTILQTN